MDEDVISLARHAGNHLNPFMKSDVWVSERGLSSNGAENWGQASSLLDRSSILLKNKMHLDGGKAASPRVPESSFGSASTTVASKARWRAAHNVDASHCVHFSYARERVKHTRAVHKTGQLSASFCAVATQTPPACASWGDPVRLTA